MSDVFPTFRKCCDGTLMRSLFARSDWKSELANSDLPEEITGLIASIVRESRLWRSEKTSVAQELIAHFEDGVQSGHSFSKLNRDFGDAAVTAELIRRSKIRNRPMLMIMLRATGIGIGVLLSAYVLVTVYFHLGKPTPNFDYVADLNRVVSEADEQDKAWPIYRPLWTKYGFSEGGGFRTDELFARNPDDVDDLSLIRPTDPGWQMAVDWLAQHEDLMDGFRRGARLPYLGVELQADPRKYSDEDFAAIMPGRDKESFDPSFFGTEGPDGDLDELMRGSTIGILLSHVQVLRRAARMFVVDTRVAVEQGDSDRAVENIKTFFGLARHAAEGEFLVCSLVGIAIAGMGFDELEEVLEQHPDFFSQQQLVDIQAHIERISIRDWIELEGERAMIHDIIQRVYTDNGNGDGRMTPQGVRLLTDESKLWGGPIELENEYTKVVSAARNVAAPVSLFLCASRKETAEKCDEWIDSWKADFDQPYWVAEHPNVDQFLDENRLKFYVLSVLFPATQQIRNAMDRTIGRQEGVIAALAIHRYFAKYGEWPREFTDVSPEFVAEFPLDQVNGALLNFTYNDDELVIYSVGNDADDDGGCDRVFDGEILPRSRFIFGPKRNMPDGDWIVWPQRYDDREW